MFICLSQSWHMIDLRSLLTMFVTNLLFSILTLSFNVSASTNYRPACCCCLEFDPCNRDDKLFLLDSLKNKVRSFCVWYAKTQVVSYRPIEWCYLDSILMFCDDMLISCRFNEFYMNPLFKLIANFLRLLLSSSFACIRLCSISI